MRIIRVSNCKIITNVICRVALLGLLHLAAGCSDRGERAGEGSRSDSSATTESASVSARPDTAVPGRITGEVVETMESGGYTYVLVRTPGKDVWAAGPLTGVTVGQKVSVSTGMPMQGFYSKTLDRTFDIIYFVPSFDTQATEVSTADPHELVKRAHGGVDVLAGEGKTGRREAKSQTGGARNLVDCEVVGEFAKASDGHSVAEVYAGKAALAGKKVKVRGIVVKFTPAIMGTNWLHLQDGTGAAGSCDLAVTTTSLAAVGDLITVQGVLAVDKDFGGGYRYDVLIEGATLTVE